MMNLGTGASAEIVYDGDTIETIIQKMESNKYLIDMRKNVNQTLDEIVSIYYAKKGFDCTDTYITPKTNKPKYKFNI